MRNDAAETLQSVLLGREQLLWIGGPDPGALFSPHERLLLPVSLAWAAFTVYWEAAALGYTGRAPAPAIVALLGLLLVPLAAYVAAGRFAYKAWKRRRTVYAVTSLRVLVVEDGFRRRTTSAFFGKLGEPRRVPGAGGRESLLFGAPSFAAAAMMNSGLDLLPGAAGPGVVAFFDFDGAGPVEALVDARRKEVK
jgi:hypothetical protein